MSTGSIGQGASKGVGLTARFITDDPAGLTPESITPLTADRVTQDAPGLPSKHRRYKPRARKCKCGCGRMVTPIASAPHKRYYDDACRQRDHRRRVAKARKVKAADPILEVMTCAYCGATFFAEQGRDAKFCSPSHRTAAYRHRREAAIAALVVELHLTEDEVVDMIERMGMTLVGRYLRQRGYDYDEQARQWGYALRLVQREA